MAMAYDVTELATALKPWLLEHLLDRGADTVTYFDPDIRVYGSLEHVADLATEHGIVLTPHLLTPLPRDGMQPDEAQIMGSGAYNLGFIAVGRGSRPFLAWWKERLARDAISDQSRALFTDQRWIDLLPSLYVHHVLRDPGCNVAYWNADARPIARTEDGWTAAGEPLRFFHFSGYRPHTPWLLSRHAADRPRVQLSEHPDLRALCDDYADALRADGAHDLRGDDYGWGRLGDGRPVTDGERRFYREALLEADAGLAPYPPNPFDPAGPAAYLDWLHGAARADSRVSRFVYAAWSTRPDLRAVFPDPFGRSEEHLLAWLEAEGADQLGIPFDHRPEAGRRLVLPPPAAADVVGVNVVGYLKAELGIGQIGRFAVDAGRAAGLEVTSLAYDRTVNRQEHPFPVPPGEVLHGVNIVVVNADQLPQVARDFGPELRAGRPTIGIWAWEVEEFPAELHPSFELVDEVWALSSFSAEAIAKVSPVPVHVFPEPVLSLTAPVRSRAELGLPDGTVFLFAFDHMSVLDRKNPVGLIEAFTRAFAPGEATLVLKSVNGHRFLADRERLRYLIGDRTDIVLRDGYEAIDDVHALMAAADCYVSLHRSEGYGLTMAEAMALGTPVIATGYSGNLDFMDGGTAMLVPYRTVQVPATAAPYPTTSTWAEPDLDVAATLLRSVHDDPEAARAQGERGRDAVLSRFPLERTAGFVRERVLAHQPRPDRDVVPPPRLGDAVRDVLARRPDIETTSRHPALSRMVRRTVNRTLAHHDEHVATQIEHVVALVEELTARGGHATAELRTELGALRKGLGQERAQREHAEREIGRLRGDLAELAAGLEKATQQGIELIGAVSSAVSSAGASGGAAAAVLCDVGLLHLPARDTVMAPWVREYGTWEPVETAVLRSLLRPGDAFLDVGAHVGYHVLGAAKLVGRDGHVLAVEPSEEVLGLLRHNVAVNLPGELQDVVSVLRGAAWDVDTRLSLVLSPDGNSGATRVEPTADGAIEAFALGASQKVLERTWRVVMTDIEGYDHRALRGLLPVLRRDRPHVLSEFSPGSIAAAGEDPVAVIEEYASWGYDVRALATALPVDASPRDIVRAAKESDPGFVSLLLIPATP
jgi:FkbM family methyltransferase